MADNGSMPSIASASSCFSLPLSSFERLQPLRVEDIHAAVLRLPPIKGLLADPVPLTNLRHRAPGLLLAQHADDLRFVEPAFLHVRLLDETDSHSKREIRKGARHRSNLNIFDRRALAPLRDGLWMDAQFPVPWAQTPSRRKLATRRGSRPRRSSGERCTGCGSARSPPVRRSLRSPHWCCGSRRPRRRPR